MTLKPSHAPMTVHQVVAAAPYTPIDVAAGGLLTVDGVALKSGDRVLVMKSAAPDVDQSQRDSGVYVAAPGAWQRAPDWSNGATIRAGINLVYVLSGDTMLRSWLCPGIGEDGQAAAGVVGYDVFGWTQGNGSAILGDWAVPFVSAAGARTAALGRAIDAADYPILNLPPA